MNSNITANNLSVTFAMEYAATGKYMSGSMPFHTLDPNKNPYNFKGKKHATIDLDSFLYKKHPPPELSPKFGTNDQTGMHRQAISQGTKIRCPRSNPYPKDRCSHEMYKKALKEKENPAAFILNYPNYHKKDVSNSMLMERNGEVMKEVKDCMNKSYDSKKHKPPQGTRSHSHTQKPIHGYEKPVEPGKIYPRNIPVDRSINNKEIDIGLGFDKTIKNPAPVIKAWAANIPQMVVEEKSDHRERGIRIEAELRRIRRETPGHGRGRIYSLFEEIIAYDPHYGKALKQIKEIYEGKISQLNERVGRHDIKCKEYKEVMEKEKRLREDIERKYDTLKSEMKKQILYIESQKAIIKDLKGRLENTKVKDTMPISPNATLPVGYLKPRENSRSRIERVVVPPLDLSRLRRDRGSNKPRTDTAENIAKEKAKRKEYQDELSVLLDDLSQ